MKNSLVKCLCFVVVAVTLAKSEQISNSKSTHDRLKHRPQQPQPSSEVDSDSLPNLWDDEVVNRMVREVLARDLAKENAQNLLRTRHRRDVSTTATTKKAPTSSSVSSRKSQATPKSSRKPVRQTQTNKNKNRVTQSTSTTTLGGATLTTRATVKPTTIVASTTQFGNTNSLKIKVRTTDDRLWRVRRVRKNRQRLVRAHVKIEHPPWMFRILARLVSVPKSIFPSRKTRLARSSHLLDVSIQLFNSLSLFFCSLTWLDTFRVSTWLHLDSWASSEWIWCAHCRQVEL